MEWSTRDEIQLLRAVCYHRPIGESKDEGLNQISKSLNEGRDNKFDVKAIIDKLGEYYDIEGIENLDAESNSDRENDAESVKSKAAQDDEDAQNEEKPPQRRTRSSMRNAKETSGSESHKSEISESESSDEEGKGADKRGEGEESEQQDSAREDESKEKDSDNEHARKKFKFATPKKTPAKVKKPPSRSGAKGKSATKATPIRRSARKMKENSAVEK